MIGDKDGEGERESGVLQATTVFSVMYFSLLLHPSLIHSLEYRNENLKTLKRFLKKHISTPVDLKNIQHHAVWQQSFHRTEIKC